MRPRLLVVDNYDSFTYNLVHELGRHPLDVQVLRNDELDVAGLSASPPAAIVLSPGPGTPDRAGRCLELIAALRSRVPMLGVCLGHQAIGQAYGARVTHAGSVVHGQASAVQHCGHALFDGIPTRFSAGRYHSLCVDPASLPSGLEALAAADDGTLMAIADRHAPVFGVQFHPESVLTKHGPRLLANFLTIAGRAA
ncbi:MAG TPA: aminodeoxychorismate/anthranilate synthase component II [Candidatus Eremiobacteraceae bacterium]|nr:aminodeoxychorismate/anthranilate synthase component II [Candidatus Eremiobacteraceae bacterium]